MQDVRLLTPYHLPARRPISLEAAEVTAWLNASLGVWRPGILRIASGLPRWESYFDHPEPRAGTLYLIPASIHERLPNHWTEEVQLLGSRLLRISPDSQLAEETFTREWGEPGHLAFEAVGFGYLLCLAAFEAEDHQLLLDEDQFWSLLQKASHETGEQAISTILDQALELLDEAMARLGIEPPRVLSIAEGGDSLLSTTLTPHSPWASRWRKLIRLAKDGVTAHFPRDHFREELIANLALAGIERTLFIDRNDPERDAIAVSGSPVRCQAFHPNPRFVSDPGTFFNLAAIRNRAALRDSIPVMMHCHNGEEPARGHAAFLELVKRTRAFGSLVSLPELFSELRSGEEPAYGSADESGEITLPAGQLAQRMRARKQLDAIFAFSALRRMLGAEIDTERLEQMEEAWECHHTDTAITSLVHDEAQLLAERLLRNSPTQQPGFLVLNPCGFTRRVPVDLADGFSTVAEVPPFGYRWLPRTGERLPGVTVQDFQISNEFLEVDIDPHSGGLRAIRPKSGGGSRLGMQPVDSLGGRRAALHAPEIRNHASHATISTRTQLLQDSGELAATLLCHWTLRATRPVLELVVEWDVHRAFQDDPRRDYLGLRFGALEGASFWRAAHEEMLLSQCEFPDTPDFFAFDRAFVFTGGLPYLRRVGRYVDLILVTKQETTRRFEILIALDRDYPFHVASGWYAPAPVIATDRGPPPSGPTGWLALVDSANLLVEELRPSGEDPRAVLATVRETAGRATAADWCFARSPLSSEFVDGRNQARGTIDLTEGAARLNFRPGEWKRIRSRW